MNFQQISTIFCECYKFDMKMNKCGFWKWILVDPQDSPDPFWLGPVSRLPKPTSKNRTHCKYHKKISTKNLQLWMEYEFFVLKTYLLSVRSSICQIIENTILWTRFALYTFVYVIHTKRKNEVHWLCVYILGDLLPFSPRPLASNFRCYPLGRGIYIPVSTQMNSV